MNKGKYINTSILAKVATVCILGIACPQYAAAQDVSVPEYTAAEKSIVESFGQDYYNVLKQRSVLTFVPLDPVESKAFSLLLSNGMVVDPKYFPAILRQSEGGPCTVSVVGPSTVYLAAHCIGAKHRYVNYKSGAEIISGICEAAPNWTKVDDPEDWALCLMSKKIPLAAYESLDLTNPATTNQNLMLSGTGCTEQDGPIDNKLRVGYSQVIAPPVGLPRNESTIFTKSEVITLPDIPFGAILCAGDSGGPAFRTSGDLTDKRWIVGVNSQTTGNYGVSLIAATASPRGRAFVEEWSLRHNQRICGHNKRMNCL